MTKYWLNVSKLKSWDVEIRERRFMIGASAKWLNTLAKIRPGDHIVEYLSEGAHGYVAILRAISYVYEDRKEFWPHGLYEYRVNEAPVLVIPRGLPPVPGAALAKHLEFVKGKRAWGPFLQTKIREVSERDYLTIKARLEHAGATAFEFDGESQAVSGASLDSLRPGEEQNELAIPENTNSPNHHGGSSPRSYGDVGLDGAEAVLMESISRFRARMTGSESLAFDIKADLDFLLGDFESAEPIGPISRRLADLEKQKASILMEWTRLTILASRIDKNRLVRKLREAGT